MIAIISALLGSESLVASVYFYPTSAIHTCFQKYSRIEEIIMVTDQSYGWENTQFDDMEMEEKWAVVRERNKNKVFYGSN